LISYRVRGVREFYGLFLLYPGIHLEIQNASIMVAQKLALGKKLPKARPNRHDDYPEKHSAAIAPGSHDSGPAA
jgi:hypothetical protein